MSEDQARLEGEKANAIQEKEEMMTSHGNIMNE
jgi:hypothetical protein